MSHKSPLFVSTLELLVHATELYSQGDPRKYKFVILHLANAVELVLKDRVIDLGISIYKDNSNKTIGIWEAFKELENKKIIIPERPVIELLIDDRNTLQHRFGFPDVSTVYYYLENTVAFFKRFLEEEYGVDLVTELGLYLSCEDNKLLELIVKKDAAAYFPQLYQLSPEVAIHKLREAIHTEIVEIVRPSLVVAYHTTLPLPHNLRILRCLQREGWLTESAYDIYRSVRLSSSTMEAQEFKEALKLLLALKEVHQANYIPEIEGITKPKSNNESEDAKAT